MYMIRIDIKQMNVLNYRDFIYFFISTCYSNIICSKNKNDIGAVIQYTGYRPE